MTKKLGLSARQMRRIRAKIRVSGDAALVHGNKGRKPANAISDELRKQIAGIKSRDIYADMNFNHFKELLASDFGINISYGTLRSILMDSGHVSKKYRRRKRDRKLGFGELLQASVISHDWFGIGKRFVLHGFIDDATDQLTALYMSKSKSQQAYLEALKITINKHGIPMEICGNTRLEMVLDKLGIDIIFSDKGVFKQVKNELVLFFENNGIKTIEQANAALPRFVEEHNDKFAVKPADDDSRFVYISKETDLSFLDNI
ncbi:MAG: hypothetical protein FWH22_08725 [Fibromonadales bacterium]|nr:hypothetical protein [Fibromonadales bacterium]